MIKTNATRNGVTTPRTPTILLKSSSNVPNTATIMISEPIHGATPKLSSKADPAPANMITAMPYRKNTST